MNRRPVRFAVATAAALFWQTPFALAQAPPPKPAPAASPDATLEAQKAAFLALPLATRIAAQDALVWLGFHNGVADGSFGPRTRDSIVAWQRSVKATPDGVLGPSLIDALVAAGRKARAAVGFETIADPKTGARIGSPTTLIKAKNGVALDFASDAGGDLAGLYARLSANAPGRKVTYKAIKANAFFVVSGEEGGRKFYSRYDMSAAATPPIRGFTFIYPAARSDLDAVALGVANSFEPFPQGAAVGEAPTSEPPRPAATALFVAPGRALTALKAADCPNPSVGGKQATFERSDATTGLALLKGDFAAKAGPPPGGALKDDLVALVAEEGSKIAAAPAVLAAGDKPLIVASLDRNASGAPVFDRSGGLAGLVAPLPESKRVGEVALAEPHALIDAAAIGAFLGGGALTPLPASAPMSAGAIAARAAPSVAAVTCGK